MGGKEEGEIQTKRRVDERGRSWRDPKVEIFFFYLCRSPDARVDSRATIGIKFSLR